MWAVRLEHGTRRTDCDVTVLKQGAVPADDLTMTTEPYSARVQVTAERLLAGAIDLAIIAVLGTLLTIPGYFLYEHTIWPDVTLIAVGVAAYFVLTEWRYGATLGKHLLGLCVVTLDGSAPSFRAVLIRNALRFVDVLPVLYFVGIIAIDRSSRGQRIGDRFAGTTVERRPPGQRLQDRDSIVLVGAFGAIPMFAFLAWVVLLALELRTLALELRTLAGDVILIAIATLVAAACVLGSHAVRYGLAAGAVAVVALVAGAACWGERELATRDVTAETQTKIEEALPMGTSEQATLAYLEHEHVTHFAGKDCLTLDSDGPKTAPNETCVLAKYPKVRLSVICNTTLYAYIVLRDGTLNRISYAEVGDGCL